MGLSQIWLDAKQTNIYFSNLVIYWPLGDIVTHKVHFASFVLW